MEANWMYGIASTALAVGATVVSVRLGARDTKGAIRYHGLRPWQWALLALLVAPVAAVLMSYDLYRDSVSASKT